MFVQSLWLKCLFKECVQNVHIVNVHIRIHVQTVFSECALIVCFGMFVRVFRMFFRMFIHSVFRMIIQSLYSKSLLQYVFRVLVDAHKVQMHTDTQQLHNALFDTSYLPHMLTHMQCLT